VDDRHCLEHLKELLKTLSCEDPVGQHRIPREVMWNLPYDIAGEWEYDSIVFFIRILQEDHVLPDGADERFREICGNFEKAFRKGKQYDPTIRTAEGFAHHPFWKHQRELAGQLLDELERIRL